MSEQKLFEAAKRVATEALEFDEIDINNQEEVLAHLREVTEFVTSRPRYSEIDPNRLMEELLRSVYFVRQTAQDSILLTSGEDNTWIEDDYNRIEWKRWERYRNYLTRVKRRDIHLVNELDKRTDSILKEIGNPATPNPFNKRGLVVGYVQSGKTENFIALVNKALDAGYGLIIILSGIHNDLRNQTQLRVDKDVLGFKTGRSEGIGRELIGVGEIIDLPIQSLTTSDKDGDIKVEMLRRSNVIPSAQLPVVFVVKKHSRLLEALSNYIERVQINTPTLIIDDEADQASIDLNSPIAGVTKNDRGYEPSPINFWIRRILANLRQKSYVGYTATPFANILIDHEINHPTLGQDLFPKDFILTLSGGNDYLGAKELFGIQEGNALPLIRKVELGSEDDLENRTLSYDLKKAIKSFIISMSVRRIRGQVEDHNSMLIHTQSSVDSHGIMSEMVQEELDRVSRLVLERDFDTLAQFKTLWDEDYVPTSVSFPVVSKTHRWETVLEGITSILSSVVTSADGVEQPLIRVMTINGRSKDSLDYEKYKESGLHVIVVGGNKLSRGLTLEGLTVSYYQRPANNYDTLMQMGRWFGYKKGYEDLCRIYTTKRLIENFRHIALSTQYLRESLAMLKENGLKPTDKGLKILSHDFMKVTSPAKMRDAADEAEILSFSAVSPQTVTFYTDARHIDAHKDVTAEFIQDLGFVNSTPKDKNLIWKAVTSDKIVTFLEQFDVPESASMGSPKMWARYIRYVLENSENELREFSVCLMSNKEENEFTQDFVEGVSVNRVSRGSIADYPEERRASIGVLRGVADLNEIRNHVFPDGMGKEQALLMIYPMVLTKRGTREPLNYVASDNVIGLSVAFPQSNNAPMPVEYKTNTVYQRELEEEYEEEIEDEE